MNPSAKSPGMKNTAAVKKSRGFTLPAKRPTTSPGSSTSGRGTMIPSWEGSSVPIR